jgi:RNA polymerase sigma-70 factor (ECF subfamily)
MREDRKADIEPGFEEVIIRRIEEGDTDAFRQIVRVYGPRMISYCRSRLHSDEEAQDVAQEIFIRAFKSLSTFRKGERFSAWLFAIAANRLRSHFRSFESRRKTLEAVGNETAVGLAADPAAEAERSLQFEALYRAIAKLPGQMRQPVELYYFGELSIIETAEALGLSEEAVKSRLFRARKILRSELEGRGSELEGRGLEQTDLAGLEERKHSNQEKT